MSLYEDEDLGAPPTELAVGWSSGLKILQSQKKSLTPSRGPPKATFTPTLNKSRSTFTAPKLAPVIDLKTKRPIDEVSRTRSFQTPDRVRILKRRRIPSFLFYFTRRFHHQCELCLHHKLPYNHLMSQIS